MGSGNWGTHLALALHCAGIPVVEIAVRSQTKAGQLASRRFAHALGARLTTLKGAALDAEILWICTPDASIARVAAEIEVHLTGVPKRTAGNRSPLVGADRQRHQVVFHSSGALDSGELSILKTAGASVASVHPLMSFPQPSFERVLRPRQLAADMFPLAGVPFALEGDIAACAVARRLVRALHGVPFPLSASNKPLYHAFGAFTSPLLVALLTATAETGVAAGLREKQVFRLMRPIVERTVANFFSNGPGKSFSGPVARGDVDTIERHLAALQDRERIADIYRQLSRYALDTLPRRKSAQMRKVLARSAQKSASSSGSAASSA